MTELPADITKATDRLIAEASADPDCLSVSAETRITAARAALDAAILKHLAASAELEAEVTCLAIRAEKAEAENHRLRAAVNRASADRNRILEAFAEADPEAAAAAKMESFRRLNRTDEQAPARH